MRRKLRLLLLSMAGLAHSAQGRGASPPTLHFVTKPFAPYCDASTDGRAVGPLVELLQEACRHAGWRCTVEVLPWRRALRMAEQGEVDGLFPVVDSADRRASFRLSPQVLQARYVWIARQDHARVPGRNGALPIQGRRTLAAYGPSDASTTLQQLAAAWPDARVEIEPDHRTVLRKLMAGRYGLDGLALVNEAVAQKLQDGAGMHTLHQLGTVKPLGYTFAFVPQRIDPAQSRRFAAAIDALCHSGRVAEILRPHGLHAAACRPAARQQELRAAAPDVPGSAPRRSPGPPAPST